MIKHCGLVLALFVITSAFADQQPTLSRYVAVGLHTQKAQKPLMDQQVLIHFPQSITSIQGALAYVLQFSGYRLLPQDFRTEAVHALLLQPLAEVDRQIGPLPLAALLASLVGESWQVVVDPLHRYVSFRLRPELADIQGAYHDKNH